MMTENDKAEFKHILEEAGAVYKTDVTNMLGFYWRNLAPIMDIGTMLGAIDAHANDSDRGRFFPNVADLVAQIEKASPNSGHVTSDEAWAIALNGVHESETICTTAEILEALELARPIMDEGDKVGARMAFRAAYDRIVKDANSHGKAPKWFLSFGTDKVRRLDAAEAAVAQGRIGRDEIQHLLPEPEANPAMLRLVGNVLAHPAADEGKARMAIEEMRKSLGIAKEAS